MTTTVLLAGLVTFAMAAVVECYLLLGRVQLLMTYAEQLLQVGARLEAALPSKSAEPTEAPEDLEPAQWFPRLRLLADLRDRLAALAERTAPTLLDEDQADDVAPQADTDHETTVDEDETPTETLPATPSDTAPVERVDIAGGLRLYPEGREPTKPEVDDVDARLARFTYAEGHQR